MEPGKNAPEETIAELCARAEAEQDLEKLLELVSKIQLLLVARRSRNAPGGKNVTSPAKSEPRDS
jgi:hypothetical protein